MLKRILAIFLAMTLVMANDTAVKRGGNAAILSLEELADCIPAGKSFEEDLQAQELADSISIFLRNLPETQRKVFILRYWYCDTVREIARRFGFTQSKVKMMLSRTRVDLREYLIKEGILCGKE
jgi:RNA polymerase sigma-70 factor (ECF subfamily)